MSKWMLVFGASLALCGVLSCGDNGGQEQPDSGVVADTVAISDTAPMDSGGPSEPDIPPPEDAGRVDTTSPPTGCDACGPGFQCIDDVCVCEPSPHFQEKDGACLPSCGALVGAMNWEGSTCCANGCADAAQAPNTSWDCDYCCPGENSCLDSQQPPDCTPETCESLSVDCGSVEDGCGETLYCGPCNTGEDCDLPPLSAPGVGIQTRSLVDDSGPYLGLGASLFWAAWGYKFDQPKLKANLQFLADNGFNYIRALGVVGCVNDPNDPSDYWAGREIKVSWPDYNEMIAGLTDLAYDQYGLRIEWTLIGDGQCTVPTTADKYDLINRFLAMSQGREHKIVHFELANEAWQNGFGGSDGLEELREMTSFMRANSDILVAASAPSGHKCEDAQAIYDGCIADIATIHFDRDIKKTEGAWRPVRQPWEHQYCSLPVGSNNEPIGPGASVNTEHSPIKLVAGAIVTYISGLPLHVFHSNAGVRGDQDIWEMSGAESFSKIHELLAPDLSSWKAVNAHWSDSPFQVFAGDKNGTLHPDEMWVDYNGSTSGVVRAYGAKKGNDFVVFPIGIKNSVTMAPRKGMDFAVIDPITGATLECHSRPKDQQFKLTGYEAALIKGSFWCNGAPCGPACTVSGPVCGDKKCAPGVEDCGKCPGDCPCPSGKSCQNNQCKSGTPTTPEPSGTPTFPADFAGVVWLHKNVSGWPQTATLSSVKFNGGNICLNYDKSTVWPGVTIAENTIVNGNPWVFVYQDGTWYAATWEWLRVNQTCKNAKSVAGDHIKKNPLKNWKPVAGETYYFMVSGLARDPNITNVQQRSNPVKVVWP